MSVSVKIRSSINRGKVTTTAEDTQALLAVCFEGCRPYQAVAAGPTDAVPPLVNRHPAEGRTAAYVRRGFTCVPLVTGMDGLRRLLIRR